MIYARPPSTWWATETFSAVATRDSDPYIRPSSGSLATSWTGPPTNDRHRRKQTAFNLFCWHIGYNKRSVSRHRRNLLAYIFLGDVVGVKSFICLLIRKKYFIRWGTGALSRRNICPPAQGGKSEEVSPRVHNKPSTARRCRSETENSSLEDLFCSVFLQFKKHYPYQKLKLINLCVFPSLKFRILMEKILPISLRLLQILWAVMS